MGQGASVDDFDTVGEAAVGVAVGVTALTVGLLVGGGIAGAVAVTIAGIFAKDMLVEALGPDNVASIGEHTDNLLQPLINFSSAWFEIFNYPTIDDMNDYWNQAKENCNAELVEAIELFKQTKQEFNYCPKCGLKISDKNT